MNFSEFLEAVTEPSYEVKGKGAKCPKGYVLDKQTNTCIPGPTQKSSENPSQKELVSPATGYNVWGATGINGDGYAIEEEMTPKEKGESERARSSSTLDMDRRTKSAYHAARGAMIAVKQLKRDAAELKNESIDEKYLSVDDQMRISREANAKRKPYQPGDRQKQRAAQLKQMAKNAPKDTRTDAQKMSDATGPRPGSRYRGD